MADSKMLFAVGLVACLAGAFTYFVTQKKDREEKKSKGPKEEGSGAGEEPSPAADETESPGSVIPESVDPTQETETQEDLTQDEERADSPEEKSSGLVQEEKTQELEDGGGETGETVVESESPDEPPVDPTQESETQGDVTQEEEGVGSAEEGTPCFEIEEKTQELEDGEGEAPETHLPSPAGETIPPVDTAPGGQTEAQSEQTDETTSAQAEQTQESETQGDVTQEEEGVGSAEEGTPCFEKEETTQELEDGEAEPGLAEAPEAHPSLRLVQPPSLGAETGSPADQAPEDEELSGQPGEATPVQGGDMETQGDLTQDEEAAESAEVGIPCFEPEEKTQEMEDGEGNTGEVSEDQPVDPLSPPVLRPPQAETKAQSEQTQPGEPTPVQGTEDANLQDQAARAEIKTDTEKTAVSPTENGEPCEDVPSGEAGSSLDGPKETGASAQEKVKTEDGEDTAALPIDKKTEIGDNPDSVDGASGNQASASSKVEAPSKDTVADEKIKTETGEDVVSTPQPKASSTDEETGNVEPAGSDGAASEGQVSSDGEASQETKVEDKMEVKTKETAVETISPEGANEIEEKPKGEKAPPNVDTASITAVVEEEASTQELSLETADATPPSEEECPTGEEPADKEAAPAAANESSLANKKDQAATTQDGTAVTKIEAKAEDEAAPTPPSEEEENSEKKTGDKAAALANEGSSADAADERALAQDSALANKTDTEVDNEVAPTPPSEEAPSDKKTDPEGLPVAVDGAATAHDVAEATDTEGVEEAAPTPPSETADLIGNESGEGPPAAVPEGLSTSTPDALGTAQDAEPEDDAAPTPPSEEADTKEEKLVATSDADKALTSPTHGSPDKKVLHGETATEGENESEASKELETALSVEEAGMDSGEETQASTQADEEPSEDTATDAKDGVKDEKGVTVEPSVEAEGQIEKKNVDADSESSRGERLDCHPPAELDNEPNGKDTESSLEMASKALSPVEGVSKVAVDETASSREQVAPGNETALENKVEDQVDTKDSEAENIGTMTTAQPDEGAHHLNAGTRAHRRKRTKSRRGMRHHHPRKNKNQNGKPPLGPETEEAGNEVEAEPADEYDEKLADEGAEPVGETSGSGTLTQGEEGKDGPGSRDEVGAEKEKLEEPSTATPTEDTGAIEETSRDTEIKPSASVTSEDQKREEVPAQDSGAGTVEEPTAGHETSSPVQVSPVKKPEGEGVESISDATTKLSTENKKESLAASILENPTEKEVTTAPPTEEVEGTEEKPEDGEAEPAEDVAASNMEGDTDQAAVTKGSRRKRAGSRRGMRHHHPRKNKSQHGKSEKKGEKEEENNETGGEENK